MEEQSLEGTWLATSVDGTENCRYVFKSNGQFEYWTYKVNEDWKLAGKGTFDNIHKEIHFISDGYPVNERISFAFGLEGNELALGIRKLIASETTLAGIWSTVDVQQYGNAEILSTAFVDLSPPVFSYFYINQNSKGDRDMCQSDGYFNPGDGCVQISDPYNDENDNKGFPFFISGTWDYHVVNGVLVILNNTTWNSYFVKEE